jgi:hypothetical protein
MAILLRTLLLLLLLALPSLAEAGVSFNKDIRPILADACFHCHGPDPGTRKASLRLDTEAGFFDPASGPTVVKGKPDESPLYQRLLNKDPEEVMPPPEAHRQLKPSEIALLKTWISEGAPWQPHWSFITPTRPALPPVKKSDWVRNPIDAFILAGLESQNLSPAPEADPRALIRRVSLDLTGLPPSPDLLTRYLPTTPNTPLSDSSYSQLIDELLQSPAFGEHRARYWLDAARYADTHGMHFDNYREMWPYRDWVVSAFNNNLPFDQFTTDQIAGDLLPNPTTDQLIATGFQRCNITTNEGGTIDEENLALYAADRVQTIGWVYLGLTTNCSQCHDHKFDPITQRDYYSLAAFFRNTTQGPKDGNSKDGRGPVLVVPSEQDKPRWTALPTEIAAATAKREERRSQAHADFDTWLATATPDALDKQIPSKNLDLHVPLNEGTGNTASGICGGPMTAKSTGQVSWTPDGKLGPAPVMNSGGTFDLGAAGDFEKDQKFSYGAWIKAGRNGVSGGILARMDEKNGYRGWDLFQSDSALSVHIVSAWSSEAIKVSTRNAVVKAGTWQHVFVTYDGSGKAKGVKIFVDGADQKLNIDIDTLKLTSSIRTTTALRVGQRSHGQYFADGAVQDVRVYSRQITPQEIGRIRDVGPLRGILAATASSRTPQQREALYGHFLATIDSTYKTLNKAVVALETESKTIQARSPVTHVQVEKPDSPPMANVLMRGQYDQVGEQVPAASPAALHPLKKGAPGNRLGLAQWITDPANPLTPRVTVNRFWQEVFGQGLVATAEDFGIMGTAPSHPELLDWLAVEFRESGWDTKQFFKLIVSSAAYRQAAITTPEKLELDRSNTLLSRGPRFRMDAEMIRDYALAASGTLSPKRGGPGTRPYQPENIWDVVGLPGADTRKYVQDTGENLYRRTLYNFWKRMAHSPNMDIFNAPSRETCAVRRDRTNTPLQALVTLNDPQFVEAARRLSETLLQNHPGNPSSLLQDLAERVLARPFRSPELTILTQSYQDLLSHYQAQPADAQALITVGDSKPSPSLNPAELAAWTMVCNQVMNLDEALNK